MTTKDKWLLAASIMAAVANAITVFFAAKKDDSPKAIRESKT